jgi:hypothetical protein
VAGEHNINLTTRLEKYGHTEIISEIFNVYSVTTEASIDRIYAVEGVVRIKEEDIAEI